MIRTKNHEDVLMQNSKDAFARLMKGQNKKLSKRSSSSSPIKSSHRKTDAIANKENENLTPKQPAQRSKEIMLSPFGPDNENILSPKLSPNVLSPRLSNVLSPRLSPKRTPSEKNRTAHSLANTLQTLEDKLTQEVEMLKVGSGDALRKEVQILRAENETLRDTLPSNTDTVHSNEMELEIQEQKQVIQQLHSKIQQLEEASKVHVEEKTSLLSMSEFRIKATKREVTAKCQQVEHLQSQIQEMTSFQDELKAQCLELHVSAEEACIRATDLLRERDALQKERKETHKEYLQMVARTQLRKAIDTVLKTEKELKRKDEQVQELSRELEILRSEASISDTASVEETLEAQAQQIAVLRNLSNTCLFLEASNAEKQERVAQLSDEVTSLEESKAANASMFTSLLRSNNLQHDKTLNEAKAELAKCELRATETSAYMVMKIRGLARSQDTLRHQMDAMRAMAIQEQRLQQQMLTQGPAEGEDEGGGRSRKQRKVSSSLNAEEQSVVVLTPTPLSSAQDISLRIIDKSVEAVRALEGLHQQEITALQQKHEALKLRAFSLQRERDDLRECLRETTTAHCGGMAKLEGSITELKRELSTQLQEGESLRANSLHIIDRSVTTIQALEEMQKQEMTELGESVFELQLDRDDLRECLRETGQAHCVEVGHLQALVDEASAKVTALEGQLMAFQC